MSTPNTQVDSRLPVNAAITNQTALTPVRLEELSKNPSELAEFVRKYMLIHVDNLHDRIRRSDISFAQQLAFLEQLGKIAQANEPKLAANTGPSTGFGIQFVFKTAPDTKVEMSKTELPKVEIVENVTTPAPATTPAP